ncbi:TaqI-like C-terminal specificity domain-containing protein [Perlabentimonas gracilis]|uniref:TaqI-like C-terminal specificity domain-containing protein n=1 Tax=Perlabentimonas gracilis TaxID=2715279 RepID=UPI0014079D7E|nr:TaqI-like C-terminal specificity domain-containing protein [Perlabentimonas gracilis]NHB70232.1 hypothetical protein [Perlabentimonas gracilis]
MSTKPFTSEFQVDSSFQPLIGGSSFHRYKLLWNNDYWIKYGEWLAAPRDKEIFNSPEKLIFRQTGDSIIGTYVDNRFIMRDNTHILLPKDSSINLKYALSILNSKLSNFYYWTINPEKGEALAQVKLFHLGMLRIPKVNFEKQKLFIEKVNHILSLNDSLQKNINKFVSRLISNFEIAVTTNLNNFYRYDFKTFVLEFKKQKKQLTLKEQDEWEEYFNNYKTVCLNLSDETICVDKEIDLMVYNLFDINKEEIDLIDNIILK